MAPTTKTAAKTAPTTKAGPIAKLTTWAKSHKPAAVALGGGGVVALAVIHKKNAAASSSSSATSGIDPATGLPYSEELAAAQQVSPYTASSGAGASDIGGFPSIGGGQTGGSGGGMLAEDFGQLESQLADQDALIQGLGASSGTSSTQGGDTAGSSSGPGAGWSATAPGTWTNTATGQYYYGTSAPDANAPYGRDTNGVPLPSPASWLNGNPTAGAGSAVSAAATVAPAAATSAQQVAQGTLAAQTPASQETPAQRHAQEVANRGLRKTAKG
jgi:hypothetical protein